MLERLIDVSMRQKALVVAFSVGVLLFGLFQLDNTRVENLPEFDAPQVEVQTEALGLSAYEVEQLITVPLEADLLNGIAFVKEIRSQSMPSLSSIVMVFEPGTDVLDARQLVQERLTQAAGLPNVSRAPSMVQPLSSESRIMVVGLSSNDLSLIDLGVLARWTIRPRLMGIDGVANVVVWGQRDQQLQVQVDPDQLAERNIPLRAVVRTAGNALWTTPLTFLEASTPGVGGFIDGPNQRVGIRHVPAINRPEDLASVAIDGYPDVVLGDVASIVESHQPLIGDAVVDGGDGVYLIIEKFAWSNTQDTTAAVEDALAELAPGLAGVIVESDLFRPASYLERAIDNVTFATVAGLALMALVVALLFRSFRSAVVVTLSVMIAMMLTGSILMVLDITLNTMILAGMGIGALLIIDDAMRRVVAMRARTDGDPAPVVSRMSSLTTAFAYASIVLTIVVAPAYLMGGVAGEFVPGIAGAMVLTLAVGLLVGSTATPVLADLILAAPSTDADETPTGFIGQHYETALSSITERTSVAVAAGAALLVAGLVVVPVMNNRFVPDFRQTDLVISFDAAPGISLPGTRRLAANAAEEVAAISGVEQVGVQLGRAVLSDHVANVNTTQIWFRMDPDADYDATIDSVQRAVDGYPGIGRPLINTYANNQLNDELRQVTNDLVVRVYGEEPNQLRQVTSDVLGIVEAVDGVQDPRPLWPVVEPSIEIEVDLERAAEASIKPGDVRRAAATLLSGIEVGSLFEEQKVFEVVVWSAPEVRNSVNDIENLLIDTPAEEKIRLGSVAEVRLAPSERIIERDAVSRYIDIVADLPDRSLADVEDDIRAVINEQGLPYEFHVGFLGTGTDDADDARQFLAVAAASLVTILLLLHAAFSSWRLSGLLILGTVASLAGSIFAVLLWGGDYSIGSMAGFVVVAGLTLRGGIGLFDRYESLQLEHGETLGPDLIRSGARAEQKATFAALAAVTLAVVPFIAAGQIAGLEVLGPLGVAVLGGVVTSAAVTLFVLPAAYLQFARQAVGPEFVYSHGAPHSPASDGTHNVRTSS